MGAVARFCEVGRRGDDDLGRYICRDNCDGDRGRVSLAYGVFDGVVEGHHAGLACPGCEHDGATINDGLAACRVLHVDQGEGVAVGVAVVAQCQNSHWLPYECLGVVRHRDGWVIAWNGGNRLHNGAALDVQIGVDGVVCANVDVRAKGCSFTDLNALSNERRATNADVVGQRDPCAQLRVLAYANVCANHRAIANGDVWANDGSGADSDVISNGSAACDDDVGAYGQVDSCCH